MKERNEKWFYTDLTQEIIGAVMEVHRELGSGLLEYVYEEALCYELNLREISFDWLIRSPCGEQSHCRLRCGRTRPPSAVASRNHRERGV